MSCARERGPFHVAIYVCVSCRRPQLRAGICGYCLATRAEAAVVTRAGAGLPARWLLRSWRPLEAIGRMRARGKRWLAWHTIISEYCRDCGRRQMLIWWVDDAVWARYAPPACGPLCPKCFDTRARRAGDLLIWSARVDGPDGPVQP